MTEVLLAPVATGSKNMFLLKCTSEVQKVMKAKGTPAIDVRESDAPLGNWYVNLFVADRRKFFIFMSESTLLSFVLHKERTPITRDSLHDVFQSGLEHLLAMRGYPMGVVDKTLAQYANGVIAKTDSRSKLGSMNDLVHIYRHMIEYPGRQGVFDLTGIMMKVNDMPQRKLDWADSWRAVQTVLGPFDRGGNEDPWRLAESQRLFKELFAGSSVIDSAPQPDKVEGCANY